MSADLIQRLRADADGLMSFPHPSECDRLHSAFAVMQSASTELERLTAELAAARVDAERFHWLREWLVRNGQLLCVECQPTAGAKVGPYWVFRRAYMVDGTSLEGYGKTEDAAIDAASQRSAPNHGRGSHEQASRRTEAEATKAAVFPRVRVSGESDDGQSAGA